MRAVGTLENDNERRRENASTVPAGRTFIHSQPGVETPGYLQPSLRDEHGRALRYPTDGDLPAPEGPPRIARHFSGGSSTRKVRVPQARLK
jgi:hypothetical protein